MTKLNLGSAIGHEYPVKLEDWRYRRSPVINE